MFIPQDIENLRKIRLLCIIKSFDKAFTILIEILFSFSGQHY